MSWCATSRSARWARAYTCHRRRSWHGDRVGFDAARRSTRKAMHMAGRLGVRFPVLIIGMAAALLVACDTSSEAARTPQAMNAGDVAPADRSEEQTSELQSLMRNSYDVFCLKKTIPQHIPGH